MTHQPTPQAVRSPLSHAGAGSAPDRLARLMNEFSRVLGVTRVFVRHQGSEHFISWSPDDTLHYPSRHARSGSPRYDWSDRGDGVLYGYLKPDA
jgi:hypothetical protein